MVNRNLLEVNRRVLLKSFREQNQELFAHALWRYIQSVAREFQYNDGFVEWPQVREEVNETMAQIPGADEEPGDGG